MAITQQKALSKVFGDPQKKVLRKLEKRVGAINACVVFELVKVFRRPLRFEERDEVLDVERVRLAAVNHCAAK